MKPDNNYLLQGIPRKNPNCKLPIFMKSLEFLRENEGFRTVDLQRFLRTGGYSKVIKVIDALLALGIIEIADEKERPIRYVRAVLPEQLDVNVFYNGMVENADENKSGWDPSLFKTKEDCLAYLKAHYGDNFRGPVYVIETVKVGNGWEVIDCERIGMD